MSIRPLLAALLTATLAGCAGNQTCQLLPSISLTLYVGPKNSSAVMSALGKTPAALLLDTGASASTVSLNIAQQAGLAIFPIQGDLTLTGMTGDVAAGLITVPAFTLGTATATNTQFVVAPVFGDDSPLDGILGDDLLHNYDVDLNIPRHNVTLYPSTACATATLPWQGAATAVPVHEDKSGRMYLNVQIDGHSVEALLDSGAERSAMPLSLFESAGLAASGQQVAHGALSGISGTAVQTGLYQFNDMQVGNLHVPAPRLDVYAPLDYADAAKRKRAHLLAKLGLHPEAALDDDGNPYFVLGLDFIGHYRLFISHSTDMLYIQTGQPSG